MEVVAAAQRECEAQLKAFNTFATIYAVASKNKRTGNILTGAERMNLMDETTAIDLMLGDPETDKVKCPEHDNLITRSECLDYSGSHHDECSGCEIGIATKDKLIPIR